LIPAGTGFSYHQRRAARKAAKFAPPEPSMAADEAAQAMAELLNAGDNSDE
jgi:DNA-directed RNA polymerase subunit beta'